MSATVKESPWSFRINQAIGAQYPRTPMQVIMVMIPKNSEKVIHTCRMREMGIRAKVKKNKPTAKPMRAGRKGSQ